MCVVWAKGPWLSRPRAVHPSPAAAALECAVHLPVVVQLEGGACRCPSRCRSSSESLCVEARESRSRSSSSTCIRRSCCCCCLRCGHAPCSGRHQVCSPRAPNSISILVLCRSGPCCLGSKRNEQRCFRCTFEQLAPISKRQQRSVRPIDPVAGSVDGQRDPIGVEHVGRSKFESRSFIQKFR